ncbi:MAG: DUF1805 domain-containing protein [Candidatus Thermoplasmatota archaeon]|jgi:uncharacterized protein YunC (DUF1805 family)|nr:DUF1805 domain-containing protein [Candidatus Thermoplasmatota archaeon]MCL5789575.1 DUF1805 domain-containing protein [Candidatus Thermoplasmatota archaeon]
MIQIENLSLDGETYTGIKIDTKPAPIVVINGRKGFLMCGYLNMEAADKTGAIAVSISGVNSFDDLLNKEVGKISVKARQEGVKEGMTGKEALKFL